MLIMYKHPTAYQTADTSAFVYCLEAFMTCFINKVMIIPTVSMQHHKGTGNCRTSLTIYSVHSKLDIMNIECLPIVLGSIT